MEKFRNKYRIPSARLQTWDYGSNGMYFITICTKNRIPFFGEIQNGEMFLNETGVIANNCWAQISDHFEFAELGEFVIMPDHVHGIIIINKPVEPGHAPAPYQAGHAVVVEPGHAPALRQTISAMVGSYKSAVTRLVNLTNRPFGWQTRFWDSIIWDQHGYQRVSTYIINNPRKWKGGPKFPSGFADG